jgi:hypothetical protein
VINWDIDPAAVPTDALALALFWAERGFPVLPADPATKAPKAGGEWQHKATLDPEQVLRWWTEDPTLRVGIRTGTRCDDPRCIDGPSVIDFDIGWDDKAEEYKRGKDQRRILVEAGLLDPTEAMMVRSPSSSPTGKGEHWWYQPSDQANKQSIWSVDTRSKHGFILAPGNPGYAIMAMPTGGKPSEFPDHDALAAFPGLIQKPRKGEVGAPELSVRAATTPPRTSRLVGPAQPQSDGETPFEWLQQNYDLDTLLAQDGWTFLYDHQGKRHYTRPGKDPKLREASGTVMTNPDGRKTLVNFSTSVDLPIQRGLSLEAYWALTRHGGDMRAAAKGIRTTMMPRRETATTGGLVGLPATSLGAPRPGGGAAPAVAPVATPGAELVPSGEAGTPEPVKQFWGRRRELREVWWRSQVGDVSPWAVLGSILAEVAGRVGPHVALPPKGGVGAPASLNLLVAISGNSGDGKGLSSQVARGMVGAPRPPHRKPGTGQGIAAMFTEQTKEGPVQSNDTVVLNVAEIMQLGAHMNQQGATITSTLLEVYMGEELGEHYANKELRRPVKEGHYRLALVAGVQPDNAGIIFDHAASGLPQRFVWLPAHWDDAVLPEVDLMPPAPGPEPRPFRAWTAILPGTMDDSLDATGWSPSDAAGGLQSPGGGKKAKEPEALPAPIKETILVTYAPSVDQEIRMDARRRRNRLKAANAAGEETAGDPDSHLLLTKIKVGVLLAIWLDQTTHLSEEMWELAGWVIWISNDTRTKAHHRILRKSADKVHARAMGAVAQRAIVEEARSAEEDALVKRVASRVRAVLEKTPGTWVPTRVVNQGVAGRDKAKLKAANISLDDIMHDMASLGEIKRQEIERAGNTAVEWSK